MPYLTDIAVEWPFALYSRFIKSHVVYAASSSVNIRLWYCTLHIEKVSATVDHSHREIIITRERVILTHHYIFCISRLPRDSSWQSHISYGDCILNSVCKIFTILFRPQCFNSPCRVLHLRFQLKSDNGCQNLLKANNHVTQRREISSNRPNPDAPNSHIMSQCSPYFRDCGQVQQNIISHDAVIICIMTNALPIIIKITWALHEDRILTPSVLLTHIYNNELDHHCFW